MKKEKVITQIPAIWLHLAGCTGCSVSVLNSVSPKIKNLIIDELIPQRKINLIFQAVIMQAAGELALNVIKEEKKAEKDNFVLIVEGAVPTKEKGIFGTIGEEHGQPKAMMSVIEELAKAARFIIALGSCASFGGISAAFPNPIGAMGITDFLKMKKIDKTIINIPGCPPHPDWFMATIVDILLRGLPQKDELDEFNRPKKFYGKLIHESCPRRADFDVGRFAENLSSDGCLYLLGCKGPTTYADCPIRMWNDAVNWCIKAGNPCVGCCEPEFPDINAPLYEKSLPSAIDLKGEKL